MGQGDVARAMKHAHLRLLALVFGALTCESQGIEKPILYNHVRAELTELDTDVRKAYEAKFKVVDVRSSPEYNPPKLTTGKTPRVARTPDGNQLGGYVLLAYVVTPDGRVTEPLIFKTSDDRLNEIAAGAIRDWRFTPGTLNGKPVAAAALQELQFETTPTEFELQVLEPTGGSISRPKGWFYAEGHEEAMYMWTISREEIADGRPYTTGVRIQAFVNVKKEMNQSAKEFIQEFIATKKKGSARILKTCAEESQGNFTRTCLETEEGAYHILYSLFWGNEGRDLAVITSAGTISELWDTYAPTFQQMSAFELVGIKRSRK
jgi:hypothetical protein